MEKDLNVREFLADWQKRWPLRRESEEVILTSLFSWLPGLHGNSYLANYLADRLGARIEGFEFTGSTDSFFPEIFESMGCQLLLTLRDGADFEEMAAATRDRLRGEIKSKHEFLKIHLDGIQVGDLIYNSYCRYYLEATLNLEDDRLWNLVYESTVIHGICKRYFDSTRVLFLVSDHLSYLRSGIPARIALSRHIPVVRVGWGMQVERIGADIDADGYCHNPKHLPWRLFKSLFEELSESEKKEARAIGRRILEERWEGVIVEDNLPEISTHRGVDRVRVFEDTGRPRVLIMAHDFFDEVNRYGQMIFPDFFEWVIELLEMAKDTEFDWYVKPHPQVKFQQERNELNEKVVGELRARFPEVRFLESTVANRQIVEEGVDAVFTVRGSVAHEFAYLGIPVVCGGDNMHMSFDFNIHPRSLEELREIVLRADRLELKIDREEVEAFCYMNNFYFDETWTRHVKDRPEVNYIQRDEYINIGGSTDVFRYLLDHSSEANDDILKASFDAFFASRAFTHASSSDFPKRVP